MAVTWAGQDTHRPCGGGQNPAAPPHPGGWPVRPGSGGWDVSAPTHHGQNPSAPPTTAGLSSAVNGGSDSSQPPLLCARGGRARSGRSQPRRVVRPGLGAEAAAVVLVYRGFSLYSGLGFPRPDTLGLKPGSALRPGLGTPCNTWLGPTAWERSRFTSRFSRLGQLRRLRDRRRRCVGARLLPKHRGERRGPTDEDALGDHVAVG